MKLKFLYESRSLCRLLFFIGFLWGIACSNPNHGGPKLTLDSAIHRCSQFQPAISKDTMYTIEVNRVPVDISRLDSAKGCILVLPGWNFSRKLWVEKSSLRKKAHDLKYILILPEMGKSIYASQFFPETWPSMKSTLSIHWVIDSLIPHLQINEHLLTPGKPNYIMGLSTGAHGAALIAEQTSGLFSGCGLLSGDYDQDALPMDKIFEATYGSHAQFPLRWRNIDNPTAGISNLNIPVFLGHGASDRVIPVSQSKQFYKALEKTHPHLPHFLEVIPAAGHDWICWDSSLSSMFKFWLDGSIKQDL